MASHPKATDLPALLAKLCDAGIEFIIVGGAACVIQGAPITTNDLDIVHRRTPEHRAPSRALAAARRNDALRFREQRTSPDEHVPQISRRGFGFRKRFATSSV
jgi:hypothetical protein